MACPNVKNIVSIQGLISMCAEFYLANLNKNDVKLTIRDLIKGTIYKNQELFYKKGEIEKEIIKNSNAIIGRTTWDFANSSAFTQEIKYYKCNESLRDSFYDKVWNIDKIQRYSIYVSQASYPLKGFHVLLKAINILKERYDNIKVYVAGNNILDNSNLKNKLKISGYANYLIKLINKYHLKDNIVFTGLLNEREVVNRLLNSHVFVQTSSIENSSNALGEAMLLGMPCVASNVGGTSDLLIDKNEGYLYPFGDYGLLAYYISKIFDEDDISIKLGLNARNHANITHDRILNGKKMIKIYKDIIDN